MYAPQNFRLGGSNFGTHQLWGGVSTQFGGTSHRKRHPWPSPNLRLGSISIFSYYPPKKKAAAESMRATIVCGYDRPGRYTRHLCALYKAAGIDATVAPPFARAALFNARAHPRLQAQCALILQAPIVHALSGAAFVIAPALASMDEQHARLFYANDFSIVLEHIRSRSRGAPSRM